MAPWGIQGILNYNPRHKAFEKKVPQYRDLDRNINMQPQLKGSLHNLHLNTIMITTETLVTTIKDEFTQRL